MGLFNKGKDVSSSGEQPLYEANRMGFWVKLYKNRIEFKHGVKIESVPLNQIASVQLGTLGQMTVIVETSGGGKYTITAKDKKGLRQAIYNAIEGSKSQSSSGTSSTADELAKLASLKEQGVLTHDEFEAKKKQLLGM